MRRTCVLILSSRLPAGVDDDLIALTALLALPNPDFTWLYRWLSGYNKLLASNTLATACSAVSAVAER
jgi:hypothetical protein